MTKMSDVAKLAKVAPATVSRVLRHPHLVSDETREKVQKAIHELNYKPNMIARQFRTKETKTILVVVPDITQPFFSQVLKGIQHTAAEHGYRVLLGDTENDVEQERELVDLMFQRQADGMILLTARMEEEKIEELSKQFPIVLACEYIDGLDVSTVSIDNIGGARKVTEHLIQLGHTKIAHIAGAMNVILSRDRLKGYKQAMISHDLEIHSSYIQEGESNLESGYHQMIRLLSLADPPTAVFVFNDEMAIGAIKAAKDSGLSVPQDIAIVGFDNLQMSSIIEPHITTIDQPKYEIGKKAMELLVHQMKGEPLKRKKFVLTDELIVRESCGFTVKRMSIR
ncbi:LacI family DNA-binding transcriptional regulator [Priestia endophytica]|uniref:LacI family DNA-binding transcriptional regulator n=1 Tax=Priestia endophytica TaxID=135735 RepID=UPI000DCA8AE0|nr:LacI family DNA-binding transcriptional regulator [Priestia endophytica]RAS79054.1 LacI family transcriptional regulator [Priestia endophytica]